MKVRIMSRPGQAVHYLLPCMFFAWVAPVEGIELYGRVGVGTGAAVEMTADGFDSVGPLRPLCSLFGPGDPTVDPDCLVPGSQPDSLEAEFGAGPAANIALGTWLGQRWRSEVDLGYHRQSMDAVGTDAVSTNDVGGEIVVAKLALNFWYRLGGYARVQPYLGGGAGLVRVDWRDVTIDGQSFTDDSDEGLLLQLGAGLEFPLSDRLAVSVDYRLQWADDLAFEYVPLGDDSFELELGAHILTLGLSYRFGGVDHDYLDDDGDRVPDYRDACLGSYRGAAVDARGCASPATARESAPSSRACTAPANGRATPESCQQLLLSDGVVVWFPDSDDELSAAAVPVLVGVAEAYGRRPDLQLQLIAVAPLGFGMASGDGGVGSRVARVGEFLVAQGVAVSALRSGGQVIRERRFDANGVLIRAYAGDDRR